MSATTEEANGAAVRAFYGRLLGGDAEQAMQECLAPDFAWENPLPPSIPFAGTFCGTAGAARYLELIFTYLEIELLEIDGILTTGPTVVVLGHETARVKATNRRYTQHWVHVVQVHDGRLTRLREYNDSAALLQAFT
jgi:ketosteroid isomerase-like protein